MMGRQFRSAAVLGALLVLIVGLAAACGSSGGGGSSTSTAGTLKPAPDFSGATLAGEAVSLSEYRGKPLVLAFMASW